MTEINRKLTKDKLKEEIEHYLNDFKIINDSFEIYRGIKQNVSEYSIEINSISQFIVPVLESLQYTFLMGLAKMLLKDEKKNIQNLLRLCGYNNDVFPNEHKREYLNEEDGTMIYFYTEKININEDIKNIKYQLRKHKSAIDNLDTIRNKFLAHNDIEYYDDVNKLFKENNITYKEIESLLKTIKDALNILLKDLDDTTYVFKNDGVEDFKYICKMLKEKRQKVLK